jgi:hypothetical protein
MAIVDTRTGNEAGDVEPCTVTATRAEFVAFVEKHHVILTMPVMTKEAFELLMEAKELAGHQSEKDRGTLQSTTIDMIRDGDDELAAWLTAVCQPLPKAECSKINCFLNINSGRKSGKGWHSDNPTEGTKVTGENSGRFIGYIMQDGARGSLSVRCGEHEYEIEVPPGCMLYATNELLTSQKACEHRHGAQGLSVSFVIEVACAQMPLAATSTAIAAAAAARARIHLNFAAHLEPWMPETFFLGAKLKYGFVGGGSVRRCAMAWYRGLKMGPAWYRGLKMGPGYPRELGKDEARLLVSALSTEDLAYAACQQGMLISRIGSLHIGWKETLVNARLLARALTLEQYTKMPEIERRQLCDQLWARAVADAALRRAGGQAAVRLWQLKELRALPSPSAAELTRRFTLEAGEAADEEAVAEMVQIETQIKRMPRGDLTAEEALAQAADEKLVLVTSANATGYKGVSRDGGRYRVQITENGKQMYGGSFETAEHAALQYARLLGPERSAAAAAAVIDLTAEEAIAQAAAEGLMLVPASTETGYKGVTRDGGRYRVQITENGKQMYGGIFETAERAALQYARLLGPERSAAAAAAVIDLTAEEAIAQAAAEGLMLVPASTETGYKGVTRDGGGYRVRITENGKKMCGGSFETAERAALQYARLLGPERSAAAAVAAASGHSRKRPADGAPAATTSGRIRRAPSCRE